MSESTIWNFLKQKGLSDCGAAGLMGNLYAESGLKSTNLQNSYEKKLGLSDEDYTAQIDAGIYQDFVHDSAGYGLAQWTFWSRKQALLSFALSRGKSIGDLEMQLDFLWKELTQLLSERLLMLFWCSLNVLRIRARRPRPGVPHMGRSIMTNMSERRAYPQ